LEFDKVMMKTILTFLDTVYMGAYQVAKFISTYLVHSSSRLAQILATEYL